MSEGPMFGQRASTPRQEMCPRHPHMPAVAYCKRCNRPACVDCAIQTEVGSICVDCAGENKARRGFGAGSGIQSRIMEAASGAPVTATLVSLNVILYLVGTVWRPLYQYLAFSPLVGYFEPWRIITTSFLHAGFFHLLFNMLMLMILGASVERAYGWWRYLSIYLMSALGGSIAIIAWVLVAPSTINQVTVGASGAVFGLFGAIFVTQRRAGMSTTSILVLLAVNLAYGFIVPGISWQAHLGGFFAGILATSVYHGIYDWTQQKGVRANAVWSLVGTVVVAAILVAATWGIYALIP